MSQCIRFTKRAPPALCTWHTVPQPPSLPKGRLDPGSSAVAHPPNSVTGSSPGSHYVTLRILVPMIQFLMYGFTVDLAPGRGAAQVRMPDGEAHGFRMPDYREARLLTDAADYSPICAGWIEELDVRLREYGCKASGTELLQHIRLHALVGGERPTVTLSAVPVTMGGRTGRLTQVQAGTVISYGLDLGGAQSIRETDHAGVVDEAG